MPPKYPYIENFCDDSVYVFSTIGQGPKGDKGDRGDVTAPIFADPIEWDINLEYEDLSVVLHNGDSYTAKKAVPAGIDIHNKNYWALTANFNAQLQTCRDEIAQVGSDLASEREARAQADTLIRKELPFYNVLGYGVVNDGVTDNYQAIQDLFDTISQNGGGTAYFPAGEYVTNTTVYVPSNVSILGDGKTSIIKSTERTWRTTKMGVVLGVAGSNVLISNINGSYPDPNKNFRWPGANFGFIGITAYDYDSAKNFSANEGATTESLIPAQYENIHIDRLQTDCTYALQTEPPDDADAKIDGLTYTNIVAPNGCVSVYNSSGIVENVTIDNVKCTYLRVNGGGENNVNISNVECNAMRLAKPGINLSNAKIDYVAGNPIEDWVADSFTMNSLLYCYGGLVASNVTIDGHGNAFNGIYCAYAHDGSTYPNYVSNCVVKNIVSQTHCAAFIIGDAAKYDTKIVNCDFSNNESAGCMLRGVCRNVSVDKAGTPSPNPIGWQCDTEIAKSKFFLTPIAPFIRQYGFIGGSYPDTLCYKLGNRVHIEDFLAVAVGDIANLPNGTPIANVVGLPADFLPDEEIYFTGIGIAASEANVQVPINLVLRLKPDGELSMVRSFPTSRIRTIVINIDYHTNLNDYVRISPSPVG